MLKKAVSGQFLFFDLISVASGLRITLASGAISGTKIPDGNPQVLLSGNIVEVSGGMYRANLFDFDCSGDNIAYSFTASGAVPRTFMVITVGGISGALWFGSGQSVLPYSGSLSGQGLLSVTSGSLWLASGSINSGVLNSGVFVTATAVVASGALSGQLVQANVVQWLAVAPNALISSGRLDAAFNVHTGVARSGTANTIQLDAGASVGTSGVYDNQIVTIVAGVGSGQSRAIQNYSASGIATVFPPWAITPDTTTVFTLTPGALTFSGLVQPASGAFTAAGLLSGQNVNVYSGQLSGQLVQANVVQWQGVAPNALVSSGRLDAAFNVRTALARSGTSTTIQLDAGVPTGVSGAYDGQVITLVGGTGVGRSRVIQNMGSSGIATVFPPWDASGVPDATTIFTLTPGGTAFSGLAQIASGPFAVASLNSGQSVNVYSGQLSGQGPVTAASGAFAVVPSGTLWLASGSINSGVLISGVFVTAAVTVASGLFTVASLNSGQSVLVYSGQLSGQPVTPSSGATWLASGSLSGQQLTARTVADKSGYTLSASGVDTIWIESGLNMRQAIALDAAAAAGSLSGAGTATILLQAAGQPAFNRMTATVNASGDRIVVSVNPPT